MLAAKMAKRPIVVRIPNMPKNKLSKGIAGLKMIVIKFINQWLLKSAKIIVAQNVEMRNQILEYYRLPNDKVMHKNS